MIAMIKNSHGEWIEDDDSIERLFKEHYEKFYNSDVETNLWVQTQTSFLSLKLT